MREWSSSPTFPTLFAATFFALMISSISFGQESKSVMVLYSLPISAGQILRAKAFLALGFSLAATVATARDLLGDRWVFATDTLGEHRP